MEAVSRGSARNGLKIPVSGVQFPPWAPGKTDYRAARLALGLTTAEADAAEQRARRLGRRIAHGEISLSKAREIIGLGAALRAIAGGAR